MNNSREEIMDCWHIPLFVDWMLNKKCALYNDFVEWKYQQWFANRLDNINEKIDKKV